MNKKKDLKRWVPHLKSNKVDFLLLCHHGCFTDFSMIQPSVSSLINTISGKGVMRLEKRKKYGKKKYVIDITFNDENSGEKSHRSRKKI